MYTVWHVDKYKITFKLVINWTNEILQHFVVSSGLSRPGIIDARVRYRAAARRLKNTALKDVRSKANPSKAWTGTEGSRRLRLRLPDFKTVGT